MTMLHSSPVTSVTRTLMLLFAIPSSADDCNIRITGFTSKLSNLNGNWANTGGKRTSSGAWSIDYSKGDADLSLQYGGPGETDQPGIQGWVIYSGGIGNNV